MKKFIVIMTVVLAFAIQASAQLPSVTLKDVNGKTVKTDTLSNNGKPLIISFFAA